MMIQLLKLYLRLHHLSMYKQWTYTKNGDLFFEKTMKAYFKVVILSIKLCENIPKFNLLIPVAPIRYDDCLCKFFKAVIYQGYINL